MTLRRSIARAAPVMLLCGSSLLIAAALIGDVGAGEDAGGFSSQRERSPVDAVASDSLRAMIAQKLRRPLNDIPSAIVSVAAFGARGDAVSDDSVAIVKALRAVRQGGIVLFPSGSYVHSRSIRVESANVIIAGIDARLHASNPMDQALGLIGEGSAVVGLTLSARSSVRGTNLPQMRIVMAGSGTAVVDNVIEGASAAGIMVFGASNFRIEGNTVRNTLADGIHMTHGANGGIVTGNLVRGSQDDMIAVVSYGKGQAAHDILIAHNDVAGNPWGRGIAVVGGRDITISDNAIREVRAGAGVLIAREGFWNSNGSSNIVVERNLLEDIQTRGEVLAGRPRNGQGAIEIFSDGKADPDLAVHTLLIRDNEIRRSLAEGVRMIGSVCDIELADNRFSGLGKAFLQLSGAPCAKEIVSCRGNLRDGAPVSVPACGSFAAGATGAAIGE